jgi:flagellar hook-associated protein 3 FlgL
MRISTQYLFEQGASRISDAQTRLQKTQEQVASGRRILTPSDDPVASARALEVTQAQATNTQYGRNRVFAENILVQTEGTLGSVTELLLDVQSAVASAGNGTLGDNERGFIATEIGARLQQLIGLANSRDASGNYLFSGFQSGTPAFVQSATGATYQGDAGQQLVQVDAQRQLALGTPGSTVFQGGGQDVFATLSNLVTLLNTPGTAGLAAGLATATTDLDLALDNVLTVRASLGTRLQEIESLNTLGTDRNLQYSALLSELQDLDYTEALTRLTQQQVTLEAAQKSFAQTSKLSLFNFI